MTNTITNTSTISKKKKEKKKRPSLKCQWTDACPRCVMWTMWGLTILFRSIIDDAEKRKRSNRYSSGNDKTFNRGLIIIITRKFPWGKFWKCHGSVYIMMRFQTINTSNIMIFFLRPSYHAWKRMVMWCAFSEAATLWNRTRVCPVFQWWTKKQISMLSSWSRSTQSFLLL